MDFSIQLTHKSRPSSVSSLGVENEHWWRRSAVTSPSLVLHVAQHLHPYDLCAQVQSGNKLNAETSTNQCRPVSETGTVFTGVGPSACAEDPVFQGQVHIFNWPCSQAVWSAVRFSILSYSTIPGQRHVPPNLSMPDCLGVRNSRSPVLGLFHSPMLSLGTKCKSVAVPASIKNFKNRTKQTEKDFHNNLKIH